MGAVDRGLRRARDRGEPEASATSEPPFDYGIIVCAMRFFTAGFSRYYARPLPYAQLLGPART